MHLEAYLFVQYVKSKFPQYFTDRRVLDCGSGDINGNNRYAFVDCDYTGIDICSGSNVDVVSKISTFTSTEKFDTIISTECLEHDIEFKKSLRNMLDLLGENGLLVFTCASHNRPEHGTKRTSVTDSFATLAVANNKESLFTNLNWYPNYYQNLGTRQLIDIDVLHMFASFEVQFNEITHDLYFYGIKKSNPQTQSLSCDQLSSTFNNYKADKNSFFHNYTHYYNPYLSKYQYENINLLEIGVYKGESLRAWREYFKNAINIVGIDNGLDYSECKKVEDKDMNVYVEIGSQNDVEFLKSVSTKYDGFDIVVDDGSHQLSDVKISFETLFPLMRDKGVYVIEDTVCFRDDLQYFFSMVRNKNRWVKDCKKGICDHCVNPTRIPFKTRNPIEYSIGDIIFTNSAIIIYKDVIENYKDTSV
jgi:SAM-dependent methyltransferase